MAEHKKVVIPEHPVPGKRLGRHVHHDPKSREFPAFKATQVKTTLHPRVSPIFNQGNLGACVGNASAGLLGTPPFVKGAAFSETDAVKIYELATTLDDITGSYPPDDTGTTGLAAGKACVQLGYISSYAHCFGLQHTLESLVLSPVIIGINWYDSFDKTGATGLISISPGAQTRGGHETELIGLDAEAKTLRGANSWGADWGDKGYYTISWSDFERLLAEDGDVTVFYD